METEHTGLINNLLTAPFAGDIHIGNTFLRLKEEYQIQNVIETGTHVGATFAWLYNHFERVYTCEINDTYFQAACNMIFGNNPDLRQDFYPDTIVNPPQMGDMVMKKGDSIDFIKEIAPLLSGESMFFLDAHWYSYCPLQEELLAIANAGLKPAVIAIHDFKTDHPDLLGFDSYNEQPFDLNWITPNLQRIYGDDWTYEYNTPDNAAGALRGIIYVKRA